MHENTVFSHTKCLSRNIQSWIFFLIFFLWNQSSQYRVPLNHPINEAATKTLTFSVILFELPSEHCACGHEFIGFAEPMSPLRFMHTHSYLLIIPCTDSLAILLRLRPTIQRHDPKGPAMMILTSITASKCMTCRSSKVSVSNTMSSADFR